MAANVLKPKDRIAIINRGEPAIRFLNAVSDFNGEHDTDFSTIALFTKPDQHAKFVQRADISFYLGDSLEPDLNTLDDAGNPVLKSPYLNYARLKQALIETKANAVWVGWGFVAEHAEFVDMCDEMGLVFIGPTGDTMRALGDKIGSKLLAEKSGVDVSPWSGGAVKDVAAAKKAAKKIGFPLVIKATAGGGGRGIRRVLAMDELETAFHSASSEAEKAFGDGTVFMEAMVVNARHLEVQILADYHGNVWPVGVRDCSVQRRNQKVIEEGPAIILTKKQETDLKQAAVNIAKASNYHNAGTAEFLYTPKSKALYFMEMNTRLQVEHPVTELTTGIDMVKMQIKMAMGHKLEGKPPVTHGHAVEVRLNAEDPYNQFSPSPGKIELFTPPGGPGIRVDSGVETNSEISSAFDSMVAKILSYGATRGEAVSRLVRAIKDAQIVIEDGTTNKSFLLELLTHEKFIENKVTTRWLDEMMEDGIGANRSKAAVALILGGIEIYSRLLHEERKDFFQTVSRGRPRRLPVASTVEVEMKLEGQAYKFQMLLLEPEYYRIQHDGGHFDVRIIRDSPFRCRLYYDKVKYDCAITAKQDDLLVEVNGESYLVEQDSGGVVKSNSPAIVLNIHVDPGQTVKEGEPLVTLEAMKMEMVFQSPASGVVREVSVKKGDQVGAGDALLIIEAGDAGDAKEKSSGPAVAFAYDSLPEEQADPAHQILRECRDFMMGFDVHQFSFDAMLEKIPETLAQMASAPNGAEEVVEFVSDLFELYFRIEFIFLKRVSVSETDISSPEANFFIYLQLLGSDQVHPAEDFLEFLSQALSYYDVEHDDRTDALEEALIRLFYSHDNIKLKRQLLQSVLNACEPLSACAGRLQPVLESVIEAARLPHRQIFDMGMNFYFNMYEKTSFDTSMVNLWADYDKVLKKLDREKDEAKREELILQIACSHHSLLKYLIDKFAKASAARRQIYSQILLRRIHLDLLLHDVKSEADGDIVYSSASYKIDRTSILNITYVASFDQLTEVLASAAKMINRGFGHQKIILDFYLNSKTTHKEEEYADLLAKALENFENYSLLSRIRVTISDEAPITRSYLFDLTRSGYQERRLFRGISEVLARRLYLERLQGFETRRLPTEENIYLLQCVAQENPEDQRLIAFSEVREPPPEAAAAHFSYPALRREFQMIMKAMRQEQEKYGKKGASYWNQIIIYIRPLLAVRREEFVSFLRGIITGYEHVHLEKIRIYALMKQPYGDVANVQVEVSFPGGVGIEFRYAAPTTPLIEPLSQRDFRQALARRRGINYPYEIVQLMTSYFYKGEFEEYDLIANDKGELIPTSVKGRPEGGNNHGMVFGVITNYTPLHPQGMKRIMLLGDGNFGLGCLAEPECRYTIAAIELAREMNVPLEWYTISSGAKISMDNGTENLDWTARVLREIILFTQAGGEINIIVDGINVGAQSYWNAEATMMMHTKGCLIMTPKGTMVLTGKTALDYAGSVSAEDNLGIGGLQRIMGPNGQVHYPARDLLDACDVLFRYYALTYVAPGETRPRPYAVNDDKDRNICETDYKFDITPDFDRVGNIFDDKTNPGKKKPFDMRQVMAAVADEGRRPLERWPLLQDADTSIVWDTTLGGICVSMIGIQSFPIKRHGELPNDGPDTWTGGTLFPMSSRKIARAINAASGRRPVVLLANLSGFDGSPESLRRLQLEFGAEIGRSVVNFEGPIVFCVLSRYHGGAYVVFSNVLNEGLKSIALEGTYASVIGGAPAAVVVFPREVRKRTLKDPRIQEIQEQLDRASSAERSQLQLRYQEVYKDVHMEKQNQVAAEFDTVHSVARAKEVGSLDDIISPTTLRPYLIEALQGE